MTEPSETCRQPALAPLEPPAAVPAIDAHDRAALPHVESGLTVSRRRYLALLGLAIGVGCLLAAAALALLLVALLFG